MPEKPLYIYGAGGLGREILALVKSLGGWTPAGFIDDHAPKNSVVGGLPVIGGSEVLVEAGVKLGCEFAKSFGDVFFHGSWMMIKWMWRKGQTTETSNG